MVDVTQTMACIQCGACVSDCLSMEVDPLFIGPAALAKAYRFVGDPRDAQQYERLKDLAEDPHGIYDCTHCFKCIEACPKGVAPMSQIMRLRRRRAAATTTSSTATTATATSTRSSRTSASTGLLHEAELLLARLVRRQVQPDAGAFLMNSLPVITTALLRRKVDAEGRAAAPAPQGVQGPATIFDTIERREERVELNLYITGYDEDEADGAGRDPTQPRCHRR